MALIMCSQGAGFMMGTQSASLPMASNSAPSPLGSMYGKLSLKTFFMAVRTFSILRMQANPESIGINCSIKLWTIAQLSGGPLEGSVIDLSSAPKGIGMVIGLPGLIAKHGCGFFGGLIGGAGATGFIFSLRWFLGLGGRCAPLFGCSGRGSGPAPRR